MTRYRHLMAILVLAALTPVVRADSQPSFTLGKAVPSDAYIYVHSAYNPETEFLHKYWGRVWTAFKESGVIDDVQSLITSLQPQADQERFQNLWKQANELLNNVDWNARIEEFVYTSRWPQGPVPEFLVLVRYENEEKAAKNAEAFTAMLKAVRENTGGENGGFTFAESQAHGAAIKTLSFKDVPIADLHVAVRGPVVALAVDKTMLDDSLALLAGEGDKKSLVESQRYRDALAKLPPPEDTVVFFDIHALFDGIRGVMKTAAQQAPQSEGSAEVFAAIDKALNEVNLFDYLACTVHTDGFRQIDDTVVTLGPNASKSLLYDAFCKPEQIEKFDRFIPKEAEAYTVSSGVNWAALYDGITHFIRTETPQWDWVLTKWEQTLKEADFDPDRDVFSWLGQQTVTVKFPAANPSPMNPGEWVLLVKVKNEKLAAQKVKAGLDKLNEFLTTARMPLASQPAEVEGAEGFRAITINNPLLAMAFHPVYGVAEGQLIFASSADAVQTCLATARGKHAGVSQNDRFVKEGLIPKGPVTAASFSDLTHLGKEISEMMGGISMAASLGMTMAMAQAPQGQEAMKPAQAIIGIIGKLAPVAAKLNFFVSQSSVSTFDKGTWHTQRVTNYRPPKAPSAESPAPSDSTSK